METLCNDSPAADAADAADTPAHDPDVTMPTTDIVVSSDATLNGCVSPHGRQRIRSRHISRHIRMCGHVQSGSMLPSTHSMAKHGTHDTSMSIASVRTMTYLYLAMALLQFSGVAIARYAVLRDMGCDHAVCQQVSLTCASPHTTEEVMRVLKAAIFLYHKGTLRHPSAYVHRGLQEIAKKATKRR